MLTPPRRYNPAVVTPDLLQTVLTLPVADRIDLLRRLQDNLRADPAASPLTDAHRHILEARLADFRADPNSGSPWDEVSGRLQAMLDGR